MLENFLLFIEPINTFKLTHSKYTNKMFQFYKIGCKILQFRWNQLIKRLFLLINCIFFINCNIFQYECFKLIIEYQNQVLIQQQKNIYTIHEDFMVLRFQQFQCLVFLKTVDSSYRGMYRGSIRTTQNVVINILNPQKIQQRYPNSLNLKITTSQPHTSPSTIPNSRHPQPNQYSNIQSMFPSKIHNKNKFQDPQPQSIQYQNILTPTNYSKINPNDHLLYSDLQVCLEVLYNIYKQKRYFMIATNVWQIHTQHQQHHQQPSTQNDNIKIRSKQIVQQIKYALYTKALHQIKSSVRPSDEQKNILILLTIMLTPTRPSIHSQELKQKKIWGLYSEDVNTWEDYKKYSHQVGDTILQIMINYDITELKGSKLFKIKQFVEYNKINQPQFGINLRKKSLEGYYIMKWVWFFLNIYQ